MKAPAKKKAPPKLSTLPGAYSPFPDAGWSSWGAGRGGGQYTPDLLIPTVPLLTWDTAVTDNTPTLTVNFDEADCVSAGSIDGSNFDTMTLEWATTSSFEAPFTSSNTLDAGELAVGSLPFTLSALADGTWYARARHNHVVAGVSHTSDWSSTVSQTIDATAPTITSASSANNVENTVLAHSLTASESVTWTIIGGADQLLFEISGSTLRWAGNGTKDFEAPDDADTDNAYVVQVRATDAATNNSSQTITITVTDVSEGGGGTAGEAIGLLLALTKAT